MKNILSLYPVRYLAFLSLLLLFPFGNLTLSAQGAPAGGKPAQGGGRAGGNAKPGNAKAGNAKAGNAKGGNQQQRARQQRAKQQRAKQQAAAKAKAAAAKKKAEEDKKKKDAAKADDKAAITIYDTFLGRDIEYVNLVTLGQSKNAFFFDLSSLFTSMNISPEGFDDQAPDSISRFAFQIGYDRMLGPIQLSLRPGLIFNSFKRGIEYYLVDIGLAYVFSKGVNGLGGYFVGLSFGLTIPGNVTPYRTTSQGPSVQERGSEYIGKLGFGGALEAGYTFILKQGILIRPYIGIGVSATPYNAIVNPKKLIMTQNPIFNSKEISVSVKPGLDFGVAF